MKHGKVFSLVAGVTLVLGAAVPAVMAQESLIERVCLVTDTGGINDGGFNESANNGMERAAEEFDLETTIIESQTESEYEANIQICLDDGFDTVITVGFLIADATYAAAEANPDAYFIGVDQFVAEPLPNLVGIQYREDQGGFLAGALAALVSESGSVAGVYGIAIPPVVKFRNGFEQGALYINPDIELAGVYIDSFDAPDRGAAAAEQLIGEGADVIFGAGGPTGQGGIIYAAGVGIPVIGVDQDEYFTTFGEGETPGAEFLISSAVKRVDNGVYEMLALLGSGEALPEEGLFILSVENDGIGFAPAHDADVPEEVTAQLEEILAGLIDGSIETGVDPQSGELLSAMEGMEATEEMAPMETPEATPGS